MDGTCSYAIAWVPFPRNLGEEAAPLAGVRKVDINRIDELSEDIVFISVGLLVSSQLSVELCSMLALHTCILFEKLIVLPFISSKSFHSLWVFKIFFSVCERTYKDSWQSSIIFGKVLSHASACAQIWLR